MTSGARLPALAPHPLDHVPPEVTGGVVAVGNFDGMHKGHRVLLETARVEAERLGVPSVVLTFEPHPRTVFRPEAPVFRLTPLPAKARLLRALGIGGLVVAHFDRAFSTITADEFVEEVLIGRLKLNTAVIGFNFHFGKGRAGTPALLADASKRLGFAIITCGPVAEERGTVSSTAIRDDLAAGDITAANQLLGYRWFVTGEVIHGDHRGRTLGFPTANLRLGPDCRLRHGIYAVRLQRADGSVHDGVASYGRRPTFDDGPPLLETYLFDFSDDLYGEEVAIFFVRWIRPEVKFPSAEALVEAVRIDVNTARRELKDAPPPTPIDEALAAN
jgi:riboflavin kinase/FMN adenylyltransferase